MLSSLFPHRKFIRLDGGMGSMLQKGGMPVGALPEVYNITEPERIIDAQKQFVAVGSDIIYANTFGANRHKMAKSGYSVQELIAAGKMTGTVKQDAEGMAAAIAQIAKAVGEGTALKDAVAATAESNTEMYSVAEGVATKLYVAYAPYTA